MKLANFLGMGLLSLGTIAFVVPSVQAAMLTDAQIVEAVKTADQGEIKAAKMAKSKASDSRVKDFAKTMIDDHKANEKEEKKLAKNNNIKPEKNDIAKNMKSDVKEKMKDLKKYKGSAFDKAYIDSQVAMHQQLLNDLDQTFIPNAQNSDLKSFLQNTRTHVQEHLNKAQEIQASLSTQPSSM